jgi:uncharacterized OsmC-like protein
VVSSCRPIPDNNPLTEVLALKTETIEATIEKWTKEPSGARGTPTVTARGEETQAVMEAGSFTWRADLPPALGGTNQAPSPTALLLSALAGCAVVFVRDTIAPQLGIQVGAVEATVKCETDARGLLGMAGAEPDLRNLSLEVSIESPAGEAAVAELSRVWHERCPIYLALVKPTDVAVQFSAI